MTRIKRIFADYSFAPFVRQLAYDKFFFRQLTDKARKVFFLFFLGLGVCNLGLGSSKEDSLKSALNTAKMHDTDRVNILNDLAFALYSTNPDSTIILARQATALAQKINYKKGEATAHGIVGVGYTVKGDYPMALENHLKALSIDESLNNKEGIAKRLGNIGLVYDEQADYPKALDYYFKALKIGEAILSEAKELSAKTNAKDIIAIQLGNIGVVYWNQSDYPKALDYYFRALKMNEELGNKNGIATALGNIGIVYVNQANYPKVHPVDRDSLLNRALDYYFRALKMKEELGNKNGMTINLGNIGNVYKEQAEAHSPEKTGTGIPSQREGLYNKALDYYFRALKIKEELGYKNSIAITLGNIGALYIDTKKYAEAEKYLLKALEIDKEIAAQLQEMTVENYFTELYEKTNRYQLALEHYKKAMALKDTIFNEEKSKEIGKLEAGFEFEKQILKKEKEHEKQQALTAAELKRQRLIGYAFISGFGLMLILAFVIYRSYTQKKKANKLLEDKNTIIAAKNKNITDSIRYAQNIQSAILPSEAEMKKTLPEHFVYFQPRDIVSGDFYWFHAAPLLGGGGAFIAVCDCTGHGVPGAFVSMIGNDLLNQLIIEKGIGNPGEILTQLNNGVKSVFTREGEEQQAKDGMDMVLLKIPNPIRQLADQTPNKSQSSKSKSQNITIQFAGANNPLYIVRNGELSVIDGDKTAIGGDTEKDFNFTNHKIVLKKGDTIYMFSDGYKDQFGGDTDNQQFGKGKKFMKKRLSKLFLSIQGKSIQEQKEIIHKTMMEWKGNLEQTDDICVIGIRV